MRAGGRGFLPVLPHVCAHLLGSCLQQQPTFSFEISLSTQQPTAVHVELRTSRAPVSSLALRGYAAREDLRLSDSQATGPYGSPLRGLQLLPIRFAHAQSKESERAAEYIKICRWCRRLPEGGFWRSPRRTSDPPEEEE